VRIAFLGLGLIGGSIVRALRAADPARAGELRGATLVAWTPRGGGPRSAKTVGAIDIAAPTLGAAVDGADLVVIAAPPLAVLDLLGELRRAGHEGLITDVASTKAAIVQRAAAEGLRFVGGHPLAGRETSGFEAADPALFDGRLWVITVDGASEADVERVESLASACGALSPRMTAADHDELVAGISHLPLVLSAVLVEAVAGVPGEASSDWATASALAASGWRDMTRLARGDAEMGAGIVATNAGPLASRLRDVRAVIDRWLTDLEASDGAPDIEAIAARLRGARARLDG
jgi:prephenate dehydrogenase